MKKDFVFEVKEIRDTERGFVHRFAEVDGEEVTSVVFSLTTEAPSGLKRGQLIDLKITPRAVGG